MLPSTVGQQIPQMLPPAPQMSPQVSAYTGGGLCDTPPIPTYAAPPCNGPNAVNITRRVFTVINGGFTITVTPAAIVAVLGALNGLFITTDSTTTGVVRDILVTMDAYAQDAVGGGGAMTVSRDFLNSYSWSVAALLAGTITVNNTPFPTVIPIGSAIRTVNAMRAFWTQANAAEVFYISPDFETTHDSAPAPIEIALPQASNFQVIMTVPSRTIAPALQGGFTVAYTGMVSILLEEQTQLGSVAG